MEDHRYRYIAEWFDPTMKVKREFLLSFFPSDNSVEMFDLQIKKLFLKRIRCESLDPADVYVGGVINVLSRQLFLVDYGDEMTRTKFTRDSELSIGFVRDSGFRYLGTILDTLYKNGISVTKGLMLSKTDQVNIFKSSFFPQLTQTFAVFELRGENAVEVWKKILGLDSSLADNVNCQLGSISSHCLCPMMPETVKKEHQIFFPGNKDLHCNTAVLRNSTCCIIKPHAVREGSVGRIVQDIIDEGFRITALEFINFDLPNANEFLEIYKGIIHYFQDMVSQLTSGPSVALEVTCDGGGGGDTVHRFREFTGPMDSELAKKIRPNTLRAKYGKNKIKNAVHCTDLDEDGKTEVEYVFRVLALP